MEINVRPGPNGWSVITVIGEVPANNADDLRNSIVAEVDAGHFHLVIEFAEDDYVDSTCLGVLVGGLKRCRAHDGSVNLLVPPGASRFPKILRMTGLTKVFGLFETLEEATMPPET